MEGVEIPKPSGKIVSLMDLHFEPTVKPEEKKEESSDDQKKKKHFRPKKQLRNVFTRMQGDISHCWNPNTTNIIIPLDYHCQLYRENSNGLFKVHIFNSIYYICFRCRVWTIEYIV